MDNLPPHHANLACGNCLGALVSQGCANDAVSRADVVSLSVSRRGLNRLCGVLFGLPLFGLGGLIYWLESSCSLEVTPATCHMPQLLVEYPAGIMLGPLNLLPLAQLCLIIAVITCVIYLAGRVLRRAHHKREEQIKQPQNVQALTDQELTKKELIKKELIKEGALWVTWLDVR